MRLTLILQPHNEPAYLHVKDENSCAARMRPWPPRTNLLRFLLALYINFQLSQNKRKAQSESRRRQSLTTSLTGPSQTIIWATLPATTCYRSSKRPKKSP